MSLRRLAIVTLGAALVYACSEMPTERTRLGRPTLSASPTDIDFEVAGFSYGPEFEEIQPWSCTKGTVLDEDTIDVIPDATDDPPIIFVRHEFVCPAIGWKEGGPYDGGEIRVMAGRPEFPEHTLLGFLNGEGAEAFSTPANSAVAFRAYPKPECNFLQWQKHIAPSTNETHYENPLIQHASVIQYARITGEFQCGGDPPPPPPPPPDSTPTCDEPPCDGGGDTE
jgi:hypothetical protein